MLSKVILGGPWEEPNTAKKNTFNIATLTSVFNKTDVNKRAVVFL